MAIFGGLRFIVVVMLGAAMSIAARAASQGAASGAAARPNFIVIIGEGQGWSSTSVRMDDRVVDSKSVDGLTPNLERLAQQGMRFGAFSVADPRCTPSRAALLTGINPATLHMTYVSESGEQRDGKRQGGARSTVEPMIAPKPVMELPAGVATTGDVIHDAGYATAHFGKWHVGRVSPAQHGFDETDGANTNVGPGGNRSPNPGESAAITDKGLAFIEKQVKAGRPFYVQLSHYGAGSIDEVSPESLASVRRLMPDARGKQLVFAGGMRDLDNAIGRVLDKVDALGIADRTFIIFTTDHGTPAVGPRGDDANAPLVGGKGSVREGGIRVPFIVCGPRVHAGACSEVRATGMDLLPTMAELAGVPIPIDGASRNGGPPVEGGSLVPVLVGGGRGVVHRSREEIVIHFPHDDLGNGGPQSAIYLGEWKLIREDATGRCMLFDMSTDWAERNDLASRDPERAREMVRRLDAYLDAVGAQRAVPNPEYSGSRGD